MGNIHCYSNDKADDELERDGVADGARTHDNRNHNPIDK